MERWRWEWGEECVCVPTLKGEWLHGLSKVPTLLVHGLNKLPTLVLLCVEYAQHLHW